MGYERALPLHILHPHAIRDHRLAVEEDLLRGAQGRELGSHAQALEERVVREDEAGGADVGDGIGG